MPRKKTPDLPPGDDGRTIAAMNVEGMPWYAPPKEGEENGDGQNASPLTREEARYYTWGAVKAALVVVGVMCGGITLFILFCQFVWFK